MIYPIGIQNFEKIRTEDFLYVDKTAEIYKLAKEGRYYFLSRPRRFGKSLLVSTMEAYFAGRKELFSGLAIEKLEAEWKQHPVLHLDLSGVSYTDESVLERVLSDKLAKWETLYGAVNTSDILGLRFKEVIEAAYNKTGNQVAILIDEYDKPIIDNLGNEPTLSHLRSTLQGFYSVMKSMDARIRFGFLTGVTKIGKMSVFSGLNNLNDISMIPDYVDICGVSETELHEYFDESISELSSANEMSKEECYVKLKSMYDGYHFCEDSIGIYNPFSLLNTFQNKKFREYWFETGTPGFLVEVMRKTSFDVTTLENQTVDSTLMSNADAIFENPVPYLFQSGYLTITGYNDMFRLYQLGFPNQEVKNGFLNCLLKYYVPMSPDMSGTTLIYQLWHSITEGNPKSFMQILSSLFANTSYQIQGETEKDFQYAMYIISALLGEYVQVERTTSNGRIDLIIQTKEFIYIFELKVNADADVALRQIDEKGYARPFEGNSRKLFKIGVDFSTATRRIEDWKIV
mgnify:FL=1